MESTSSFVGMHNGSSLTIVVSLNLVEAVFHMIIKVQSEDN